MNAETPERQTDRRTDGKCRQLDMQMSVDEQDETVAMNRIVVEVKA